jgi:hypothetical protein
VIAGGSAAVAAGGTATVAFTIATQPSTTVFNLADFNLELQISVKTGTSSLQFAGSQSDPAYDHSGYVFSGASFVQDNGLLIWSNPISTVTNNDTITAFDFNDSPLGYTPFTSSSTFLLATVQVQANPNASAGDSFSIALVNDPSQTFFDDPVPYTSTPASVTVSPSAVNPVPAPPSLVLAGIGALSGLLCRWRSQRKSGRAS